MDFNFGLSNVGIFLFMLEPVHPHEHCSSVTAYITPCPTVNVFWICNAVISIIYETNLTYEKSQNILQWTTVHIRPKTEYKYNSDSHFRRRNTLGSQLIQWSIDFSVWDVSTNIISSQDKFEFRWVLYPNTSTGHESLPALFSGNYVRRILNVSGNSLRRAISRTPVT